MADLKAWKNASNRKPLVITGVRQCGKTYVMKQFGERSFPRVAYVNLERNALASGVFDLDLDPRRIVSDLETMVLESQIVPGQTLLILDEIQACLRAVSSLKYFCEDIPDLHVVCAGSLLGVALKHENISFPVGKVQRMRMYPMNFREFLAATGGQKFVDSLKQLPLNVPIPNSYASHLEASYRDFLIVGGMPEAVAAWVEHRDLGKVEEIQDDILEDYAADLGKHAPVKDIPKVRWIWESIPKQIAKENNKFVFSQVKEGRRAHELEDALQWVIDAGLAYRVEMVATPEVPLNYAANASYFKVYLVDVGLLRRRAGVHYRAILEGSELYARFKGALAENYVHNELLSLGLHPFFWRSGNSAEVDFLAEVDGEVVPVEVKSADNTMAKSFRLYCKRYEPRWGVRMSLKNAAVNAAGETTVVSLPLYSAWRFVDGLRDLG